MTYRDLIRQVFAFAERERIDLAAAARRVCDNIGDDMAAPAWREYGADLLYAAARHIGRSANLTPSLPGEATDSVSPDRTVPRPAGVPFTQRIADWTRAQVAIGNSGAWKPIGEITRDDARRIRSLKMAQANNLTQDVAGWDRVIAKLAERSTIAGALRRGELSARDVAFLRAEAGVPAQAKDTA